MGFPDLIGFYAFPLVDALLAYPLPYDFHIFAVDSPTGRRGDKAEAASTISYPVLDC
mgnify:CR=1 FL=1